MIRSTNPTGNQVANIKVYNALNRRPGHFDQSPHHALPNDREGRPLAIVQHTVSATRGCESDYDHASH